MRLAAYEDRSSQALHLTRARPRFMVTDRGPQPLWVVERTYDACAVVVLGLEGEVSLVLANEAQAEMAISTEAMAEVVILSESEATLEVKSEAAVTLDIHRCLRRL